MTLKIDTKFEGKLTCAFKNDVRNLANFHQNTWKSLRFMCYENEEWYKIWKRIDLSVQNWYVEFDEFWPTHLKISKICALMGCFWPKYVMFELKKYRGVVFDSTEYWCKIWRKTEWSFQKRHEEVSKFSPEHVWKSKSWDFCWVLLSKVENVWAWNLQGSCVMTM